jgi:hypothetical protein
MKLASALAVLALLSTARADNSVGSRAQTSSVSPIRDPQQCIEQLEAACHIDLDSIRRLIPTTGVHIAVDTYGYSDHGPTVRDERRIRPAQLTDERTVCHIFDGVHAPGSSMRCRVADRPGTVECEVRSGGDDQFKLLFKVKGAKVWLVDLSGHVIN